MPIMSSAQRSLVVTTARSLLLEGCHFVNGGRGDNPGNADTPLDKPKDSVTLAALNLSGTAPMVQAAKSWRGGAICKGRFKRVGGRELSTSAPDLQKYLKTMRGIAGAIQQEVFPPMDTDLKRHILTPRTVDGEILLGESCVGRRHCDCIDFVNYCYSVALSKRWQFDLPQYSKGLAGKTAKTTKVNLREGNIVLRGTGHSAICHKGTDGKWKVIEAPGGEDGLIESAFHAGDWTTRVRVSFYQT